MKQKIFLIGPVEPYRGGISQYTTQLYKSLQSVTETKTISFKRLYPKWLYPGENDKRDDSTLNDVEYLIDVYNPFSLNKVVKKIPLDTDLVIISWWTLFWQPGLAYIAWKLKKRGIKTVFLCHNLYDHSSKGIKTIISKKLLKTSNNYIVHSSEMKDRLLEINNNSNVMQRLHPIYNQFPLAVKKLKVRGRLEILFFGFIRPYKGLEDLLEGLSSIDNKDIYLTISGELWEDKEKFISKVKSYNIHNIELNLEYSDEVKVATLFKRADLVALPYRSATGSGVVAVAYNYNKPVLVTKVGGLPDAVIAGKTGWLIDSNSPDQIAGTLESISRADCIILKPEIEDFCRDNSWDKFALEILRNFI